MHKKYPHIFTPLRVKNVVFRNRIFAAPNMLSLGEWDGSPSEYMISYFSEKAKGGAAMVTVGDTPVDEENGVGIPRHIKLIDQNVNKLSELAFAIKANGAVANFELNHPGRMAENRHNGKPAWGPSAFKRPNGGIVLEMDESMMEHTVGCFANAAAILKKSGWDMCILHGAHGWLLGQFLSRATNRRIDGYGGSLENRTKFPIRVIEAVREAVGNDFLIDFRLSGDEYQPDGFTIEECIAFLKMIEDKVDMVHISAGLDTAVHQAIITHPNSYLPNGYNVKYAAAVKAAGIKLPVTTVGGINTPEMAEERLAGGQADAIAMCRALIADPYWVQKVKQGRINEIHQCLRCTNCLAEMGPTDQFRCDVNPLLAHEIYWSLPEHTKKVRSVYVAGGGPGGMTAAITAAERGHKVTLYEQSERLGGALNYTDYDKKFKLDLYTFKEKLIARLNELPIEIRLNTKLTPEILENDKPDAVFAAIGARPIFPPITGMSPETVTTAFDAYAKLEAVGKRVVLIGGGLIGAETAIFLADMGRDVTVVEMTGAIAAEANIHHGTAVLEKLEELNATCLVNTKCIEILNNGIRVMKADGTEAVIEADTVLLSAGYAAKTGEVDAMINITDEFAIIGDCKKAFRVRGATHDGYFAAVRLG